MVDPHAHLQACTKRLLIPLGVGHCVLSAGKQKSPLVVSWVLSSISPISAAQPWLSLAVPVAPLQFLFKAPVRSVPDPRRSGPRSHFRVGDHGPSLPSQSRTTWHCPLPLIQSSGGIRMSEIKNVASPGPWFECRNVPMSRVSDTLEAESSLARFALRFKNSNAESQEY